MKSYLEEYSVRKALIELWPSGRRVLFFSIVTTLLLLAPSLYMLEVYDRVVNSRSFTTLLMLTVLVVGAYVILELIEKIRLQVCHAAGLRFEKKLRGKVYYAVFRSGLNSPNSQVESLKLKDLKSISDFLGSKAFLSLVDSPLSLIVLVILFLIHPLLGWFSVAGALVQISIGLYNNQKVHKSLDEAQIYAQNSRSYAVGAIQNAQVIESMGMLENIHQRWQEFQQAFIKEQAVASDYAGTSAALSKMAQSLVASLVLGLGCWLSLRENFSPSMMIVGSILGGRMLAPLVQLISSSKQIIGAFDAFTGLEKLVEKYPEPPASMPLPPPQGMLLAEGIIAGPPGSNIQVLKGIGFQLKPGMSLAVVGPSGSGKTTLARVVTGIWPSTSGRVRLDGSDIYQWNKEELGPHVGYLPQGVELFEGTLAENVARFGEVDNEKVKQACSMVGLDRYIDQLPEGYNTMIGEDGVFLSGGIRQRVALARALYGNPKFVVLDEPNASLDQAGDVALVQVIKKLKSSGITVIVITHRTQILSVIEYMMIIVDGRIQKHGPCAEILAALKGGGDKGDGPGAPPEGVKR